MLISFAYPLEQRKRNIQNWKAMTPESDMTGKQESREKPDRLE
jgi:hypothetical protein